MKKNIAQFSSSDDLTSQMGGDFSPGRALNNHYRLNGENIIFADGQGEWRTAAHVKQRFPYYGANWIWW